VEDSPQRILELNPFGLKGRIQAPTVVQNREGYQLCGGIGMLGYILGGDIKTLEERPMEQRITRQENEIWHLMRGPSYVAIIPFHGAVNWAGRLAGLGQIAHECLVAAVDGENITALTKVAMKVVGLTKMR
jgi:hypothetical protein